MAFGDRYRAWQVSRQTSAAEGDPMQQMLSDWDIAIAEETDRANRQILADRNGTAWPNDWYFGKNLGLDRYQAGTMVPGRIGKAAQAMAVLLGGGKTQPVVSAPVKKDYTPLYVIVGAIVIIGVLKK